MSNDRIIARVFKLWAKVSMMILDGKRDATTVADALQIIVNEQPRRKWREEDEVVYFSVTSDGTSGVDWITRLESKGFCVGNYAKQVLSSPGFKSTNGVTTEVAVLKGTFFKKYDRITKTICAEADKRKLSKPNAELVCLIREKFTDKEIEVMGFRYIVALHEPINDSVGEQLFLCTVRRAGSCQLGVCYDVSNGWYHTYGFAFVVSPT